MAEDGKSTLWSGTLTFGLVSIPVAVASAVRPSRSSFHLVHKMDRSRLRRKLYCPGDKSFVPPEHRVRGYEIEEGKYVEMTDSEIESVSPHRSKAIEIEMFVERSALSPEYYDRPYYLVPTGPVKPYLLLVDIMAAMERMGISRFVMHAREHLCAIRSMHGALILFVLRYPGQIRSTADLSIHAEKDKEIENKMSTAIEGNESGFNPSMLRDSYQERIDRLIRKKKRKHEAVEVYEAEDEEVAGETAAAREQVDLIAALEESLAREKKRSS